MKWAVDGLYNRRIEHDDDRMISYASMPRWASSDGVRSSTNRSACNRSVTRGTALEIVTRFQKNVPGHNIALRRMGRGGKAVLHRIAEPWMVATLFGRQIHTRENQNSVHPRYVARTRQGTEQRASTWRRPNLTASGGMDSRHESAS